MTQLETTGERIQYRRKVLGISQTELADETGIIKQTLYKYERGIVKNIPYDTLKKIASALAVEPDWLLGWEVEANPNADFLIIYSQLTKEQQFLVLQMMRIMKEQNRGSDQ